jgi:hypothetical protein
MATKPEQQPRPGDDERAKQAREQQDRVQPGAGYKGTNKSAEELEEMYGLNPDKTPRTEPAPDGPECPPVSMEEGPFDTETIYAGCNAPLTQECVDWYNKKFGYSEEQLRDAKTKRDEKSQQRADKK